MPREVFLETWLTWLVAVPFFKTCVFMVLLFFVFYWFCSVFFYFFLGGGSQSQSLTEVLSPFEMGPFFPVDSFWKGFRFTNNENLLFHNMFVVRFDFRLALGYVCDA